MMTKKFMMIVCCALLVGCPSVKPVDDDMNMSKEDGGWLWFSGTTYSVPDYYSMKQIDKKHQIDSVYYVKNLRCKKSVNRCAY
jgi:hypothetical protein